MDPLYELLVPYFDKLDAQQNGEPVDSASSPQTAAYLSRLSTLSVSDLASTEPASLLHAAQSHLRSLQALSKRSHKAVISSASHLAGFSSTTPSLDKQTHELRDALPELESAASDFAEKYERSKENTVLDRRKQLMLLSRNVDRVSDVLDMPTLLSSTVTAAQPSTTASTSASTTSYASALDLHAHIKRLNALYPRSNLVSSIHLQAEAEMQNLVSVLITALQSPTLKLAGAMRTVGLLRRVAPDLADDHFGTAKQQILSTKSLNLSKSATGADGALGSLFLVCRLRTLHSTFAALEPLRDLADQETTGRKKGVNSKLIKQQVSVSALGSQSERYLKRFLEIFREQSFSILSMYKNIFPSGLPTPDGGVRDSEDHDQDSVLPAPLASFAQHLVDLLLETLREYMPNIQEQQARTGLLTQVLYCAGSLGRLGADFGTMLALLEEDIQPPRDGGVDGGDQQQPEWLQVMEKHRITASRLDVLSRSIQAVSQ